MVVFKLNSRLLVQRLWDISAPWQEGQYEGAQYEGPRIDVRAVYAQMDPHRAAYSGGNLPGEF